MIENRQRSMDVKLEVRVWDTIRGRIFRYMYCKGNAPLGTCFEAFELHIVQLCGIVRAAFQFSLNGYMGARQILKSLNGPINCTL